MTKDVIKMEDKPFGRAISGSNRQIPAVYTSNQTRYRVMGLNDKDCAASLILLQMFIKKDSSEISLARN